MKRIYTFTLDDDVPLSNNVGSDIREIAYWLFTELSRYEKPVLCIEDDKKLYENELYDIDLGNKYIYKFTSDNSKIDYRLFEPFMISDTSFGFTVYDGSITDDEILEVLNHVLKIIHLNYKFTMYSKSYDDSDINNRLDTINRIICFESDQDLMYMVKPKKRVKKKINPLILGLGLIGR